MKVEPTDSDADIFQYTPKSNVRKLCLKFKIVRHTMAMDFNILCHMSN